MKALFEFKEDHINETITVQIPMKYAKGNGYDMEQMLADNDVDCIIYTVNKVENCTVGYALAHVKKPELIIV